MAAGSDSLQDETNAHIRFLEDLERVDDAIRLAPDLESMMAAVLDTVLDVFQCDRAWLLFPCDPEASSWSVPMERTRHVHPGALAAGAVIPMLPEAAEVFDAALRAGRPVPYDPQSGRPLPPTAAASFAILSQLVVAVRPRVGRPWLFGLHQCSHARSWTTGDQSLFQEIGRRLGDALTSLLMLRDLRASEAKYREVVEGTDDAVARLDETFRFSFLNQAGARIIGRRPEECVGLSLWDVLAPEDCAPSRDAIESAVRNRLPSVAIENRVLGKSGDVHHMLWTVNLHYADESARPRELTAIGHDITERVKAEQELRSLEKRLYAGQKMEALGTLAGGIAHDFNNILSAIIGYADLARMTRDDTSAANDYLVRLLVAARRASELVQQILSFSRRVERQVAPVDLRRIAREVLALIRASVPRTIEIRENLPDDAATVLADETGLHQVLMNLCTNAYLAMRDSGGCLEVGIAFEQRRIGDRPGPVELSPGDYVVLSVRDTGTGITQETLTRAFEPFFTTRPHGEGSGMGLSVVHGIVRSHGGNVRLESEPGRGTTASVYLPRCADKVGTRVQSSPTPRGDRERILFVDDESALVDIGAALLAELGYSVTAVADSQQALETFLAAPDSFDLVVSDQTMPRLTGVELAAEVHRIRPSTAIILCTGYSDTLNRVDPKKIGVVEILMKPVDRDGLGNAVRRALKRLAPDSR